jgi:hypothetical protein
MTRQEARISARSPAGNAFTGIQFSGTIPLLVDDFIIEYCKKVKASGFVLKTWDYFANRKGKRQHLNEEKTRDLINRLNRYFETRVDIPRIRRGKRQKIETLISEEAFILAQYLRKERQTWNPRIVGLAQASGNISHIPD